MARELEPRNLAPTCTSISEASMKRIMFVDNERKTLDSLRASMVRPDSNWDMEFVDSGALALEEMDRRHYDVILTQMHMPAMDGRQLLEHVTARWPDIIRMAFADSTDMDEAIRLAAVAHQFVAKPCPPLVLKNIIERGLTLHQLLEQSKLREIVGRIRALPTLPKVYAKLRKMTGSESVTAKEIAVVIESDASVAARVLQLVNSAFFRLAQRITNIEQAVTYLGFKAIRNVTLSVEVFNQWPDNTGVGIDFNKLQTHVHAVATAASALTARTPIADDAMMAGLLHDIGYWILALEAPEDLKRATDLAASAGITLEAAEKQVIGATHAEIGAYLLGIWGLPYSVIEAVAYHHDPLRVEQSGFDVLAAVAISHALVPEDDTIAFAPGLTPDRKVDEAYLLTVKAPFDWKEASRRVVERRESHENMS
jgi:HD-like signal output (HDOD) protein/CheY-like chemotaxis protein